MATLLTAMAALLTAMAALLTAMAALAATNGERRAIPLTVAA